jgi:hypothetical protein
LTVVLSLALLLFLGDALVSVADDSIISFLHVQLLAPLRGIFLLFSILTALLLYVLMALTPLVPKRQFLPIALFHPLAACVMVPFLIYFYSRAEQVALIISMCQLMLAVGLLFWVRKGFEFRFPLVAEMELAGRGFSWLNFFGFLALNAFVLLPAMLVYFFYCAGLAVNHFSEGFVALRPGGLMVQVRKYVRNDGKSILLVPMSHVGEPEFYRSLSQSFPTNATVLMEGVTDSQKLLTNRLSYKGTAGSLGLAEQQREFKPTAEWVRADIDISQFKPDTIGFLNLAMPLYTKGIRIETLLPLMEFRPPPDFEQQLFDDLLRKRNRHLLEEIQARLSESDHLIVPWGAAHMPELGREIQKDGFHVQQTSEFTAIRFGSRHKRNTRHRQTE